MYQEIQYRLYINKSQIKQFRYHNGSSHLPVINKKIFLGGDPCRNKYAFINKKNMIL